jgi:hypothetical protein
MDREQIIQWAREERGCSMNGFQALEAFWVAAIPLAKDRQEVLAAITALRQLLEQPVQEPVAWLVVSKYIGGKALSIEWNIEADVMAHSFGRLPLYTHPPAQPAVPEGWKLVPVEPTEIMQDAGVVVMPTVDCHPYDAGMVYKAMLAAAPTQGE